jgi:hypothetical protein
MTWIEQVTGRSLKWRLIRAAAFFLMGFVFMAPTFGLVPPLLFRNDSPSEPLGYYLYAHHVPASRGEIVVLHNPPHFQLTWLMKTVEGVAGDLYCWDEALHTQRLNGRPMPPPIPWPFGSASRPGMAAGNSSLGRSWATGEPRTATTAAISGRSGRRSSGACTAPCGSGPEAGNASCGSYAVPPILHPD